MAPYKRKYSEIDCSDSEEPSFGKQILPVADLPDDFDGEPANGMQYLFTVRRDARALPQFTRVTNPYESPQDPLPSTQAHQASHPALPSVKWRTLSESRWRNIHKNFNQPAIGTSLPTSQQRLMPDKSERSLWWEFLAGSPESVWGQPRKSKRKDKAKELRRHEVFASGRMRAWDDEDIVEHVTEGLYGSGQNCGGLAVDPSLASGESETPNMAMDENEVEDELKIEPRDSLPTPTGTPVPSDGIGQLTAVGSSILIAQEHALGKSPTLIPREPTPQMLKLIDESMALRLLMYFTFWIHQHLRDPDSPAYRLTEAHARWMYSLLLRVDTHISADDMNLLRSLARACLAFIKVAVLERTKGVPSNTKTPVEQERGRTRIMGEQACWIIISGIVGIWGQRDLWMDAEDTLASLG